MNSGQYFMQDKNPLEMLLTDMQLAGITDVVSETPFDFANNKITSPFLETITEPAVKIIASNDKIVETAVKEIEKPTAIRTSNELLWLFGAKNAKLQIVLSSKIEEGTHPLSSAAKSLFVKMLAAINIKEADISYLVFADAENFSKKEKELALSALENKGEAANLIFVGEEATKITFGAGILKTRQKANSFASKPCGILMHPDSLLTQPLLKKIAWQDLLKFQQMVEGK